MSSEYGWTTEYALSRTLVEIGWRLREIQKRNNREYELQCKLHGFELKGVKKQDARPVKLTKEQEAAMEESLKRAKMRKKMEFKNKRR